MGYYNQLSLVLFAILCQIALSSSSSYLCPKHQSVSLLKFKNSLTIDSSLINASYPIWGCDTKYYPKTSTWNTSTDCCLWDGVVCDEFSGHVIELDLSCSLLVGTIDSNSTLFHLSHLQRLNLSLNSFSNSNISPKFGRFSSLTHLGLSNSLFSGQIPSEISQLSKLQSLQLSAFLGGDLNLAAHDFKMLLQNLTQLRDLDLFNVYIPSTIPLNFSSHITSLVLPNTGLYGILPQHVFHLPKLKELSLFGNGMLSGSFPKTRWNSSESLMLLDLTSVTFSVLNLSHNHLEGCIPKGPQFATFENNSYEGNDGSRGFPVSKGCGYSEIPERNSTSSVLDNQETNSLFLIEFLKGGLVGYVSGLCIGLSIVYFTISTGYPIWLARIIVELEYKFVRLWRWKQRIQRNYKSRKNRFQTNVEG